MDGKRLESKDSGDIDSDVMRIELEGVTQAQRNKLETLIPHLTELAKKEGLGCNVIRQLVVGIKS